MDPTRLVIRGLGGPAPKCWLADAVADEWNRGSTERTLTVQPGLHSHAGKLQRLCRSGRARVAATVGLQLDYHPVPCARAVRPGRARLADDHPAPAIA